MSSDPTASHTTPDPAQHALPTDPAQRAALCDVLRQAAADRVTGCVVIDCPGGAGPVTVWLRDGWIVSATAPASRARLGGRLVAAHLISGEQLADALQRQCHDPGAPRLGEVLRELELVDEATLRQVLREQTIDSIAVAIGGPDSAWLATPDETGDEGVPVHGHVENLLVEAVRRLDEWHAISAVLESLDTHAGVAASPAANDAEPGSPPDEATPASALSRLFFQLTDGGDANE